MIYLIVSLYFAVMALCISLEMLVKNTLGKSEDKINRMQFLLHALNSTAILLVAWSYFKN
ncbi:hypothetical protein U737_16380 [Methylomonas sp. LW13]|nr:hypothetical protein CWO84_21870 [Methylomonas sp. Kb3]QBC28344.1 hypothetical protein U737_16380 [Methylomonas sp. LW13]